MAVEKIERSTWWVKSGGASPVADGDYRYYWIIYPTTSDTTNRLTRFTVEYWLQTHCTSYTENSLHPSVPAGKSTVYINGSSIGSISTSIITINKGANWSLQYIGSRTFPIYHNDDGSASFTFRGDGLGKGTSTSTYSTANGDFLAIPSQSKIGVINTFNIDDGVSNIPITKYVSSYYEVLEISNGTKIFKTINGFENNTSVTFTEAELNDIYTTIPTGDTAVFTFTLTTYSNSNKTTQIGTDTKTATGNFTILLPTVNGAICTDFLENTLELTGDSTRQTIIKNYSLLRVSIPSNQQAVANTRQTTITKYVIEGTDVVFNTQGVSFDYGLWSSNNDYVTIYAVDSRGTSSVPYVQKFTRYIDYTGPTIDAKNWTLERDDSGVSKFVTISFQGTWWQGNFGNINNELTIEAWYRNANDGYWDNITDFLNGATKGSLDITKLNTATNGKFTYNGPIMSAESDRGFDIKNPYDIVIIVRDETLRGYTLAASVQYGEPAGAVFRNKMSLGGPYDEQLGGTQLWGDIYLNGETLVNGSSIENAITESGSNSLGSWIKYNDGTMITRQSYEREISGDWETWGALYTKPVQLENFPTAFIEPPTPTIWHECSNYLFFIAPNNTNGLIHETSATRPSDITLMRGSHMSATTTFIVHVTAIGKWK